MNLTRKHECQCPIGFLKDLASGVSFPDLLSLGDMDSSSVVAAASFFARHNAVLVFGTVYVVTIFAGNISAFINFWLSFALNLAGWQVMAVFGVVAAGQLTGDCMWFGLGRVLRNTKFGAWIKRRMPGHDKAEDTLQRKGRRILYLSKFAYGSAAFVAFSLGWTGMHFKIFARNAAIAIVIALPVVFIMAYGLFVGLSPLSAVRLFKHIELLLLFGIAAFFALEYLLSKAAKFILADKMNGNGDAE
jgi:membrane protein DedA with SNARE-associated domain